jgi:hypothetical protein
MTDVERFLAIEEIKQLKARYFRCVDTKDWDGFAALFAPDATVDYTPPGGNPKDWSMSGEANITSFVRKALEGAVTVHHGHMPEVEIISSTGARGIFAMEDLIWWPEGRRHKTLHGWGHYQETYGKIGGKWVIKTLRLTRLRLEES